MMNLCSACPAWTPDHDSLNIYTITKYPDDFPQHFVVRRHTEKNSPTREFMLARNLQEARALVPPDLILIPRQANDDPVIVESWI